MLQEGGIPPGIRPRELLRQYAGFFDSPVDPDELLGRVFLHELDHLDGVLMLDRLDPDERKRALRELRDVDLERLGIERLDDARDL